MLPLLPYSAFTRSSTFISQEWSALFDPSNPSAPDPASTVRGGWKGILYANLALIDPKRSWEFFAQQDFDPTWIDGGASRTWYLAFAAGEFFYLFLSFFFGCEWIFTLILSVENSDLLIDYFSVSCLGLGGAP